jgi:Mandelate racemase / muconate lactonizing enzyme, N-terminal domain
MSAPVPEERRHRTDLGTKVKSDATLIHVETDSGLTGIGAALGTPPIVAAIIEHELAAECVDEDPCSLSASTKRCTTARAAGRRSSVASPRLMKADAAVSSWSNCRIEPVSEWGEFPASWENTGNSRYYGANATAPTGQRRCEIASSGRIIAHARNARSAAASTSPPAPRVSCPYLILFGSGFAGLGRGRGETTIREARDHLRAAG